MQFSHSNIYPFPRVSLALRPCCAGELEVTARYLSQSRLMEAATNVDVSVPRKALMAKKPKSANVFKAALLTLFGRRKATKRIQADHVAVIVGCMRPLNLLQNNKDADHAPRETENLNIRDHDEEEVLVNKKMVEATSDHEDDVMTSKLPSPDHIIAPMSPSSECCGDSRYASALNLHELDKEEEEEEGSCDDDENENEELFDDTQGDAMIDMKAEVFIAQFYAQMKIDQNS